MIDAQTVKEVDEILDQKVSQIYKDQPLAQDWARVTKVGEELGEAIAELILSTGQNPRKEYDKGAFYRLLEELGDTAMSAVYAIQHFTKDTDMTRVVLENAQLKHVSRLR